MEKTVENIRFNVLRNALYHTARRLKFERQARWINFLIILAGASAMSGVLAWVGLPQSIAGAAAALLGAIQLVFDPMSAARTHQALQRDYYSLLAEIEAETEPDEQRVAQWYSRMVRITGDEPPTMRAVDAKAYNDALDALEMDEGLRLRIPIWHRPLQHYLTFEGYRYLMEREISPLPQE